MKKIILTASILVTSLYYGQTGADTNDHPFDDRVKKMNEMFSKPTAWSFNDYTKEGNVDVSTGAFGISIPFFEVKEEDFELPIGISYKTSGVPMDVNASEVGMNWELSAGGSITRIKRGHSDERKDQEGLGTSQRRIFDGGEKPAGYLSNIGWKSNNFFSTPQSGYLFSFMHGADRFLDLNNEEFPKAPRPPGDPYPELASSIAQTVLYAGSRGRFDYQQDIFKVNLGNLNFHFAFKHNTERDNLILLNGEQVFEGFALDEKGLKIYAKMTNIGNPDNDEIIINSIIIKDKKGIEYHFNDWEKTEYQYIFDHYSYPFLYGDQTDMDSHLSHSFIGLLQPNFFNVPYQHIMKERDVSKWDISKIIFPNGKEIKFNYAKGIFSENNVQQRNHEGEYLGYENNVNPKFFAGSYDILRSYTHKNYLVSMYSDSFTINFDYDSYRPDYYQGGYSLNKISILNTFNQITKTFKLVKQFSNAEQSETSDDFRMYLSELQEWNKNDTFNNKYSFSYNNPDNLPKKNFLAYSDIFGYYLGNRHNPGTSSNLAFPKVYLYPGETDGERVSYEKYAGAIGGETTGLDRSPKVGQIHLGTMNQIVFPTKGTLDITYEPNTYYFEKGENKNPLGPGVRVKKLEHTSEIQKIIKEYSYNNFTDSNSSGKLLFKPSYAYIGNFANRNDFSFDSLFGTTPFNFIYSMSRGVIYRTGTELRRSGLTDVEVIKKMVHISNKAMGPQSDIFGRQIIYENVNEKMTNSKNLSESYNKRYYNFYEDNSPLVNVISGPTDEATYYPPTPWNILSDHIAVPWLGATINGNFTPLKMFYGFAEKRGKNIFPFPDRDYFGMNNGLINGKTIKTELFNSNNEKVSSTNYSYNYFVDTARPIYNVKSFNLQVAPLPTHVYESSDPNQEHIERMPWVPASGTNPYYQRYRRGMYFFVQTDNYFEKPVKLISTSTTNYFSGNSIEEITNFEYSPYQYDLSSQKNLLADGTIYETKFKYINDISPGNNNYVSFGLTGIPLLIEKFKNNRQLSKTSITYGRDWIGHEYMRPLKIADVKINTINGAEEFINQKNFTQYDNKGNILEYSTENGIPITMIWGYNKTLPIAKIEGTYYSSVKQYADDIINKSNADADASSEQVLLDALTVFRKNPVLSNFQITTYTYDPLVGITTITPPSGIREIYQYDKLNRLEKIIDMDGKLLKEMKYNYKQ